MTQNYYSDSIVHHGVKGQRWGVRRYQNKDSSLTNHGKQKKAKKELSSEQKEKRKKIAKAIGISSAVAVSTIATGVAVHKGAQWITNGMGKALYNAAWDNLLRDVNSFDSFIR